MLNYVLIKGAGDLATGVACTLVKAGFRVVMTEISQPTCVRRKVSFAEAVYEGETIVEGFKGRKACNFDEALEIASRGDVAVLVDPRCEILKKYRPVIFVEATMTKKNLGTTMDDAGMVIALGPGYRAGVDVHAVIETQRGPGLGKPLYGGAALPNTGIPGNVNGYTIERVLRSPANGVFQGRLAIGDPVKAGDVVGYVDDVPVKARIDGTIRGLIRSGLKISTGTKLGDIHPEVNSKIGFVVTDKAWAVGKGVLEAISTLQEKGIPDPHKLTKLVYQKLQEELEKGRPSILYTLVQLPGNSRLTGGAHLLVQRGGCAFGTLGLFSLDKQMIARAENALSQPDPATNIIEIDLPEQEGSRVKILEDLIFTQKLVVFGAGHVALPLVEMASLLGYRTVVVDDRQEFVSRERFPKASRLICVPFEEAFQNDELFLEIDGMTNIVIVTRGHEYDLLCLRNAIRTKARYIGMIGSREKVKNNFRALLNEGVSRETLEKVATPIGLDLGGQKPEEIALSILAQLIALENGGTGKPLDQMCRKELLDAASQKVMPEQGHH